MEVWSSAMGPERVLPNSEDELGEDERPADGALLPVWSGGEGGGEEGEEEEPDGGEDAPSHTEQLQQVQHRIEVMGLHLPEAPPPDSDEEEDPEGAAAQRSRASIPMDADHVELVKRTMAAVALPSLGVPSWAQEISDDQWKDMVQNTLQSRQSAPALRLARRGNLSGP
ncbi:Male-enhanced antigen 1 [Larimichthys crocea]|uniref:Male-enhanced antigen 1 n=1 Tax=Larimichthys crocea TaxID=215358 RepID=A0A6G0HPI5_LARCR|nr:Male-enhanced antigen 1 [Larimichthys crocea]